MSADPDALVLHSSWRGALASVLTPSLLVGVSVFAMVRAGRLALPALVVLILGLGLAAVTLFDYPFRCSLGPDGIVRRCALRRQVIPWDEVTALRRSAGSLLGGHRAEGQSRFGAGLGGLAAAVGKRKYLLVNRLESRAEYDDLRARLDEWAPAVALSAAAPPDGVPPTWLYHRRYRPDGLD